MPLRIFSAVRGAEARQRGEPAVARGGFEFGQRLDAERLLDLADLGDTETGNAEHVDQPGGNLFAQLLRGSRRGRWSRVR